jgi:hypothetical protein
MTPEGEFGGVRLTDVSFPDDKAVPARNTTAEARERLFIGNPRNVDDLDKGC